MLPAASVLLMLASTVRSLSATRSELGTLIVVRASAVLITLSAVIANKAIVGPGAVVSMTRAIMGAGRDTLLSVSVTVAVKLLLPSASAFAVISMYPSLMSLVESTPLPTSVAPSYKLTTSPATGAVAPVPLSAIRSVGVLSAVTWS